MATSIPFRHGGKAPVIEVHTKKKAIYLRKSRDETQGKEDVLIKHRQICVGLCEKNGWEYTIYEEIGTSDSLEERPQMMQLLDDVEDGLYDGVVVVDYDRLSRGDEFDAAYIKRVFQRAKVKVITPQKVYDLEDETSELLMGVEALVSRLEYRRIKRRLQRGKVEGAKLGRWVQGNPPFPYVYNSEKKQVEVDESKRGAYLWMKEMALDGVSPGDIAIRLNQVGIRTNRGGIWVPETVQRVLLNPFHMGRIVYGKTRLDKSTKKAVPLDREQWIIAEGTHERLITPEERARILEHIQARRRLATRSRGGNTPLSGLVKCALCGHTHVSTTMRGKQVIFACTNKDFATGRVCPNGGVDAVVIYEAITRAAASELVSLDEEVEEARSALPTLEATIAAKKAELAQEETRLSNLFDMGINGIIPKEVVAAKKEPIEAAIRRLKREIAELEDTVARAATTPRQRRTYLERLMGDFWTTEDLTDKERHTFLRGVIDHIVLRVDRKQGIFDIRVVWR